MRINSSRKFRRDNDLEHKARIMLRCLLYIMLQNSSSPSQSSDFNPESRIHEMNYTGKFRKLQIEWACISVENL